MDNAEVSRIEAGKRQKPNVLYLKGIAEVLDLSLVKLMKLAGYNDIDINWGRNREEKRSTEDYRNVIQSYQKFYFDVLDEIDKRRNNALECKNIYVDLIDKIEHPEFYNNPITMEEILEQLKEVSRLMKPNLEKFDKSKYPQFDTVIESGSFNNSTSKPTYKTYSNLELNKKDNELYNSLSF